MQSHEWAVRAARLLRQVAHTLKATIDQLDSFKADKTFAKVTGTASSPLPTILATAQVLRDFLRTLEFLSQDCNDYTNEV